MPYPTGATQVEKSTTAQSGDLVSEMLRRRQALDQDDDDSDDGDWSD